MHGEAAALKRDLRAERARVKTLTAECADSVRDLRKAQDDLLDAQLAQIDADRLRQELAQAHVAVLQQRDEANGRCQQLEKDRAEVQRQLDRARMMLQASLDAEAELAASAQRRVDERREVCVLFVSSVSWPVLTCFYQAITRM